VTPVPAQLLTEQGPTSAAVFLLPDGAETTLGRNPHNNLILLDRHVSREHAVIAARHGRYFLRDVGSSNGTRLDGRRIECETPLRHGQVIRAGNVVFRFSQLPDESGQLPALLALEPAWLSANDRAAVHLAETILEEGKFELLPVLADALEDAGCHAPEILEHCRQGAGRHRTACWVLDLIVPRSSRPVQPDASTVMKVLPWSAAEED
jgi:pSer/pThr/pTyr-binding forkhead associated (FHA) protein